MTYPRPNIQRMTGYVPGEQPDSPSVIKLNTNENPYPPGPAVLAELARVTPDMLRKYPPPLADDFRAAAARAHGLTPGHIVATNAGDELLRLAITTFVEPGKPIGTAEPSYSLYPVLADIHGSPTIRIPLLDDWSLHHDFARRLNDHAAQLAFIVNPHAPSGRLVSVAELARVADEFKGVLLVDEAYIDFVDPALAHDPLQLVGRCPNVLLLRTLSKGYSLAGLRFGYGIGAPSLIEPILTKTKDSYNTDAVAQRLAAAALRSRDQAAETWLKVRHERDRMVRELASLGLACPPSQSNFLLVTVPDAFAGGARALLESLKQRGIFVRYFDQDRLRDKLRITLGTPAENDALLQALRHARAGN
jgi:histidinol-phosphate aminotransferase